MKISKTIQEEIKVSCPCFRKKHSTVYDEFVLITKFNDLGVEDYINILLYKDGDFRIKSIKEGSTADYFGIGWEDSTNQEFDGAFKEAVERLIKVGGEFSNYIARIEECPKPSI